MSDTRFDGKGNLRNSAAPYQAVYDIRGKHIHKAHNASQAHYEIR